MRGIYTSAVGRGFGDLWEVRGDEIEQHRTKSQSGAPRPMKMGTTCSPFPYDAAARHARQSVNLRRPAILRYATWEAASRFRGMSGYPSIAAVSVDPGIDAMAKFSQIPKQPFRHRFRIKS